MMRAAGFEDEKSFFKAVEAGQIMAQDVLPKFGEELSKMAREGGALDAVMQKTRAQMARFFNALDEGKIAIYGGGMDEGLAFMFSTFADIIKDSGPALQAFAGAFKGFISSLTIGISVVTSPIREFANLIGNIFGKDGSTVIGFVAGTYMMVSAISRIVAAIPPLVKMIRMLTLAWALSPMGIISKIGMIAVGAGSVYGLNKAFDAIENGGASGSTAMNNTLSKTSSNFRNSNIGVTIGFKSEEAKRMLEATIEKRDVATRANIDLFGA